MLFFRVDLIMWLSFPIRVFDCVSIHVSLICETLFTLKGWHFHNFRVFLLFDTTMYPFLIEKRVNTVYFLIFNVLNLNVHFQCWILILICHLMIVLSTKNGYIVHHIMFLNDVHEMRNNLKLTIILNEPFFKYTNRKWAVTQT